MPTRTLLTALICAGLVAGLPLRLSAQSAGPIDTTLARRYFREAAELTSRDGGRLWGRSLGGPLLFVDRGSRAALSELPDTAGALHALGSLYAGSIPASENVANTAFQWSGRRWAMVAWAPTADSLARSVLLVHELWHRIQDSLGFPASSPANIHLATRDGRLWLRLEARALRRALAASGPARLAASNDAIGFRRARRRLFAGSDSTERALELNEGLAEYTGVLLGLASPAERRERVLERLAGMDTTTNFERSFAYQTGPAYGLLLDDASPTWRVGLTPADDLAFRLETALGRSTRKATAVTRAAAYGYAAVRRNEITRATRRAARVAAMRKRFVTGPVLELPLAEIKLGFDPGKVEALDSVGSVYGSLRLTDRWGILQCDGSGGLIAADFRRAVVPAPADTTGRRLTGPGWVLELTPDWRLVHGKRRGDWTLQKNQP